MRRIHKPGTKASTQKAEAMKNAEFHDAPPLMQTVWRTAFEVGHAGIDRQRQRLCSLCNLLTNAVQTRQSDATVEYLLDELIDNVDLHFITKEAVLKSQDTDLLKGITDKHRALLARLREMRTSIHLGRLQANDLAEFVFYDVIAKHAINGDMRVSRAVA